MYLSKNQVDNNETITQIEFEKVVEDLLMISIDYDTDDQSRVFSYWRLLGAGTRPPLEIGINTDRKTIKRMVLFIDADCFKEVSLRRIDVLTGNLIVGTDIFKKDNDYVDTKGNYFITATNNKLTCTFGSHNHIKEAIGNDRVKFFISHEDELCGFEIYNLNESEINSIKSIQ
jgi:hypothetical protein